MKIVTLLKLNTNISLAAVISIALTFAWLLHEMHASDQNMLLANNMRKNVLERIILVDDYLLNREERSLQQWKNRTIAFRELLNTVSDGASVHEDRLLLREIRNEFENTVSLFTRITEIYPSRNNPGGLNQLVLEAEQVRLNQLALKAYDLKDDVGRLYESIRKRSERLLYQAIAAMLILIGGTIIATVSTSAIIIKKVTTRLAALNKGVEIIGSGNLDYCIEVQGKDELAALAMSSNSMAAKLRSSYTSVENLQNEIIQRIHAEEQQTVLSKQLQQAHKMEAVGIMAGGMAHDFNNILTSVIGYIYLARQNIEPGSKADSLLDKAEKSYSQARDLGQHLLTLAVGGNQQMLRINPEPLIRDSITAEVLNTAVTVSFELPLYMPHVMADENALRQVMHALTVNALEAMPSGGTLSVTANSCAITCNDVLNLKEGYYLRITLRDTGPGIPSDILPKIFDPYFSTKQMDYHKGTGLGLALCQAIIIKHSGHISAESPPDGGALFRIWLPVSNGDSTFS